MPVTSIIYQPATAQLMAAYRPIVFTVQATSIIGLPALPYVVCDIYVNDVYYKSIIRTAPDSMTSTYSVFSFDISTAIQEYLQPDIAAITNRNLLQAPHMSAKVYCKFRDSGIDPEGFTQEGGTKPVQGSKFITSTAGDGFLSHIFFAINSVLQHEDNQNLALHLNASKTGVWANNAFPLTHRNRYYFCPGDSDHYPVIYTGDCVAADLKLNYRLKGQSNFSHVVAVDVNVCPTIDFSVGVNGNQVQITLDTALLPGETAVFQYKKQADSVWIDAGVYNGDILLTSFYIDDPDREGDYDLRMYHFCTPCLNADAVYKTFTIATPVIINTAWRGINPACVIVTLDQTIYVKLDFRDEQAETIYTPNNVSPTNIRYETKAKMYAMFFSDVNFLTPLVVNESGLQIFVKERTVFSEVVHYPGYPYVVHESLYSFVQDVTGTEVFLGMANIHFLDVNYSSYPTVVSTIQSPRTFAPWTYDNATYQVMGGRDGYSGPQDLEQYNTDTNVPTGPVKPNDILDPDYIPPTADLANCAEDRPAITTVVYQPGMKVNNLEFAFGSPIETIYGDAADNTNINVFTFLYSIPKFTPITMTIRAIPIGGAPYSGKYYVRVEHADLFGVVSTTTIMVNNFVLTTLPAFVNIIKVTVSKT